MKGIIVIRKFRRKWIIALVLLDLVTEATGGCLYVLGVCVCVLVAQFNIDSLWLWSYATWGSSVQQILQPRILECMTIPFSKDLPNPGGWNVGPPALLWIFIWAMRKPNTKGILTFNWHHTFKFCQFLCFGICFWPTLSVLLKSQEEEPGGLQVSGPAVGHDRRPAAATTCISSSKFGFFLI